MSLIVEVNNLLSLSHCSRKFVYEYYLLLTAVTILFWIVFNVFDQRLFFSPYLAFYIPKEQIGEFILSTVLSAMMGIVATLNVYYLVKSLKYKSNLRCKVSLSMLPGSVGVLSSLCLGCSVYLNAFLVSLTGLTATSIISFFTLYDTSIKFGILILLSVSIFILKCKIENIKEIT